MLDDRIHLRRSSLIQQMVIETIVENPIAALNTDLVVEYCKDLVRKVELTAVIRDLWKTIIGVGTPHEELVDNILDAVELVRVPDVRVHTGKVQSCLPFVHRDDFVELIKEIVHVGIMLATQTNSTNKVWFYID